MMVVENLVHSECSGEIRHNYVYRLTKSDIKLDLITGSINVQAYGIEVERQEVVDGNIIGIERDSIQCISPHRHKVHNMLKMLHEHAVSPIHLVDILGELVDECTSDFEAASSDLTATN